MKRRTLHPPRRLRVALIVETSLASGREILRGIAAYLREQGPWSVYHEPRGLEASAPTWLGRWDGDGIIARIQNQRIAHAVLQTGLPVVDVLGLVPSAGAPLTHVDDAAIAQLAAEHLLERGFRHFGFCGVAGAPWSDARRDRFVEIVRAAGCDCAVCTLPPDTLGRHTWERQQEKLIAWIRALPKPAGAMVCNDPRGPLVLEACRRLGVAVPEEMAVIGVDNDQPLCEIADPPLSSVIPDHYRVGYEGAALLDRLMRGERPPPGPIYVPPAGLITRQSSDVLAMEDREVAAAVRLIREHACDGMNVDDLLRQLPLSRSTLQRRFREALGRSVHDEIQRVRLRRVCELLAETDLPIKVCADKAGFVHRQYLGKVFKAATGLTLAAYRRRHRRAE